ncbi:hypothetical protein CDAR_365411 [Caerostris darwini]|uniref:Uncharacterized protein n=1 Tax=Caerostris darwini TaxID=1538125 RepID=A0AAV4QD85_9ARAC|nr:hypothetical protein CDAR_365411 [Caerostris darwini]
MGLCSGNSRCYCLISHDLVVKTSTFQQLLGEACSELQLVHIIKFFLSFIKREALSVSTCKPTIGCMDDYQPLRCPYHLESTYYTRGSRRSAKQ